MSHTTQRDAANLLQVPPRLDLPDKSPNKVHAQSGPEPRLKATANDEASDRLSDNKHVACGPAQRLEMAQQTMPAAKKRARGAKVSTAEAKKRTKEAESKDDELRRLSNVSEYVSP